MSINDFLPEPLPADPFPLFDEWFRTAQRIKAQPNPNAMVLATLDEHQHPAARIVLCKRLSVEPGYVVFFTNYESDKGRQLISHPHAAVVFHWDTLQRQVRLTGRILKSPADESDEYFASRAVGNRIGAWASHQSRPLASRAQLARQVSETEERFGVVSTATTADIPRPPHWGGFRLWPETVELWIEGPGRVHDRAIWSRALNIRDATSFDCGAWTATRLNP